jgi:seryl-tRNA synthetase
VIIEVTHDRLADAPAPALAGLEADLAFCHPAILSVIGVGDGRIAVRAAPRDAAEAEALRRDICRVADLSIASYRFVPEAAPLWTRAAGGPSDLAALADFRQRFMVELGPGQWALTGAAATLRASIDARFHRLALACGAEPWHLPSIESTDDLLPRVGYLASHAQHVTWGVHLTPRFDSLRRFAADARERAATSPHADHEPRPTGFILEPVVCHNVYRALRGARLDGTRLVTALGSCYRFEGCRFAPLLRQWEFSMREAILVGAPDELRRLRERILEATLTVCDELDLGGALEIATDPFFVSEAGSARAFQAMQSTKLELRLDLGGGAATAAASFNLHGTHFTQPMDIRGADGELLETACVGWGIERWMAALVARRGTEPSAWRGLPPP